MDDRELGFYMRCLNHSWVNGSLPADQDELARVMRCTKTYLSKVWARVSRCFEPSENDASRLVNGRQEKERQKALEKSVKATESIRIRYERSKDVVPRALARVGSGSVSVVSEVNPEGVNLWTEAGFLGPDYFEVWWAEVVANHPNKNHNGQAKSLVFERIVTGQLTRDKFETGYAKLMESKRKDWTKEGGKYCTNLFEIIENRLYNFEPVVSDTTGTDRYETLEERDARITREDAERRRM